MESKFNGTKQFYKVHQVAQCKAKNVTSNLIQWFEVFHLSKYKKIGLWSCGIVGGDMVGQI